MVLRQTRRVDIAAIRGQVEATFLSWPDETITGTQLVGTVVSDDRSVVVVLREVGTGDLHRIANDAAAVLSESPGEATQRRMEEFMDGVLNYESFRRYRGRDTWGVHQWDDPTDAEVMSDRP